MAAQRADVPMADPQAQLERALIDEYLHTHGYELRTLHELPAERVKEILRDAALYAAGKLTEVEARASYVQHIHGALTGE